MPQPIKPKRPPMFDDEPANTLFTGPERTKEQIAAEAFARVLEIKTKADLVERTDHAYNEFIDRIKADDADPANGVPVVSTPAPAPIRKPTEVVTAGSVPVGFAGAMAAKLKPQGKTPPHLIVKAGAGTGKTFTIINGLKSMRGCLPADIVPTDEQRAIWDAMALSAGAKFVAVVSFNKPIADNLRGKVPAGVDSMTNHAMGFKSINRQWKGLKVEENRVKEIIAGLKGTTPQMLRQTQPILVRATEQLVALCKQNLVDGTDPEELDRLATHYEVEFKDKSGSFIDPETVYELVPAVLERCKNVLHDYCIDFNDMIWLPVVLDLPMFCYDVLCVDEAQDLNRAQQAMIRKAGKRLILVGDPKQAIYGFAGADADSMPRMERELAGAGVTVLPLSVTRRCGKAIVKEANKLVPNFFAHESNGEGLVQNDLYSAYKKEGEIIERAWGACYLSRVEPGDMVLCRCNAPLVGQCLRFLKNGVPAKVMGRNVGQGLISLITKSEAETVADLITYVENWAQHERAKELAKRNPSEGKLILIDDKADCILAFTADGDPTRPVQEVISKIEAIFTDDEKKPAVRLSSIHKAKGLEADRVWFLEPDGATCPHPMARSAWQYEQELNLRYVGITRAIAVLTFVS